MITCPTTDRWQAFLSEEAVGEGAVEMENHLAICTACQQQLDAITNPATINRLEGLVEMLGERQPLPASMLQQITNETENSDEPPLPKIPGYAELTPIGQGGSSIVYRARDTRLQRLVAIKLLRAKASPAQRQRFQREATLLASLHHHNVARILEVGTTADQPHLVLEYIAGGSLARYLNGVSQPALPSARLVLQLAQAMHTAHQAGFIHRDLKPGNILLDSHFGAAESEGLDQFVPRIIDFGIAKYLDEHEDLTNTKDFLGTPSYMAPEQITRSDAPVDGRTDVYALGIILYELLTGRPPFRTASPIDTMLQIKHDEPVAPSRFEPKLPRDLENICLKCIEKDAAGRYADAQALADDLGRFVRGEPVHARPIPRLARGWRWCRRNPGWAIAAGLLLAVLTTAAVVGPYLAHREHQLREAAAHERNKAQEHLDLAGQALEEMVERLIKNQRLQDNAFEELQQGLIVFAVPYLEKLVAQEDSTETLKLRQARSLLQLAGMQTKRKELDKAEATYQLALERMKELQSSSLPRELLQRAEASMNMEYGRFLNVHHDQNVNAEQHYRHSLALLQKLRNDTDPLKIIDVYAMQCSLLGALLQDQPAKQDEALELVKEATRSRDVLVEKFPDREDLRHYAAMTHMNLAIHYRHLKQTELERAELGKALELETKVNQSKGLWIESPYYLSLLEGELGMSLAAGGQRAEALPRFRRALQLAEALVVVYPSVEKYIKAARQWKAVLAHYEKPS
jgi:tRNA A-37 threonylcarbamoyl transferase component Bud32/tetratricopeptide (TPR) repeat protein